MKSAGAIMLCMGRNQAESGQPGVDSALSALRLFNEKADKLERLSFTKKIISEPSGFRLAANSEGGITASRHGPDDESIDAFVFTLRFFVQDNENSSFRNMAKMYDKLHASGLLSEAVAGKFSQIRGATNDYLSGETFIQHNDNRLTRRQIFDVFMWGGLAHANKSKKAVFDQWRQVPYFFPLVENEFVHTLVTLLGAIFRMRHVNGMALKELQV
ncbi:MAG: hypothetical protein M3N10_02990 [Actinomycetota bacterium]|nr:hypothetical protein [Actinomycetota bacterium]